MVSDRPSAAVDWTPYRSVGIGLVLALAANVWTGNGLWLAYTALGSGVFLILVGLARTGRYVLPTRAAWMLGVAMVLHYLGGSLSGLHTAFGVNGLYYVFLWWDNLVHALGSAAVAVAAAVALEKAGGPWTRTFLAVCVAILVGVLAELYEFTQFVLFGTVDQGFYTNTLLDLYYNLLGAAFGAWMYVMPGVTPSGPSGRSAPPR